MAPVPGDSGGLARFVRAQGQFQERIDSWVGIDAGAPQREQGALGDRFVGEAAEWLRACLGDTFGQDAPAEAKRDKLAEHIGAVALEGDARADGAAGEAFVDQGAGLAAGGVEHPVAGFGVCGVGGAVEVERLFAELGRVEVIGEEGLGDGADDEGEIEVGAAELVEEDGGAIDGELELDVWVLVAELADGGGEDVEAGGIDHADAEGAGAAISVGGEPAFEGLGVAEDFFGDGDGATAGLGEFESAGAAFEEGDIEAALDFGEGLGEGGLADAESLGGGGDGVRSIEFAEVGELLQ